jgi:hypothetical protein
MIPKSLLTALFAAALALADSAAGISWTPPSTWKSTGEKPMRAATYSVPPAGGDSEPAECAVYYFGQGQGGSVQANIDRWIGQFQQANGKPSKDAAQTRKREIHGLSVTTVDVSGAYSGMGGPMMASHASKPGYRMLAAIVEAPQGAVFFKFTGPAKTVTANQASYEKLLASLKK